MAQQAPKKPTSRSASSGKRAASSKRAGQSPFHIRREIWAAIVLFFCFVALLSFFNVKGFAINWYRSLVGSLVGYGFYIMPFALGAAGALLIIKRKGKARLRVFCIMMLPVLAGVLRHLLQDPTSYSFSFQSMGLLMENGRAMQSGGLISGAFALLLRAALSNVGGVVLCLVLVAVCIFLGFNTSLTDLWAKLKPLPEPEEEPDGQPPPRPPRQKEPKPARRLFRPDAPKAPKAEADPPPKPGGKRQGPRKIDIMLDEALMAAAEAEAREGVPEEAPESLYTPPSVATPAEFLAGEKEKKTGAAFFGREDPGPTYQTSEVVVEDPDAARLSQDAASAAFAPPAGDDLPLEPPAFLRDTEAAPPFPPSPAEPEEHSVERLIEAAMEETGQAPDYLYPPVSLLRKSQASNENHGAEMQKYAERLVDTLESFSIESNVVDVTRGPTVTRYELQLKRGTKVSRLTNLSDDIALSLGAAGVRISTIPDKLAVGIEVPNEKQEVVTIRDILDSPNFRESPSKLSFAVGKDLTGSSVVGDIAKMPHMLIAGTTGSGKSVCINSILISLLYKSSPKEVRLIMVDPKMIELGIYNGIPHLLIPVVTDPKKAASALNWAVGEMMKRYKLFSEVGARDLVSYNAAVERLELGDPLPQVVIVIDELADLMFVAANEVEEAIARIAQMARAAGMHLIIATQRPSADVITGIMKANIPSRVAFAVASQIESRIILDQTGAEKLIGKGDMLYAPLGQSKPLRVQGCFITTGEVEEVVSFIKQTGQADYSQEVMDHIEKQAEGSPSGGGGPSDSGEDELLPQAIEIVVESGQASVSMLQRRLKLGYSRAARLVDQMQNRGIVGPFEGSKPRQVLITKDEWKEMILRKNG